MQNFQDTSEKRKRSFISDFSICKTAPLNLTVKTKCREKIYSRERKNEGCFFRKAILHRKLVLLFKRFMM